MDRSTREGKPTVSHFDAMVLCARHHAAWLVPVDCMDSHYQLDRQDQPYNGKVDLEKVQLRTGSVLIRAGAPL